MATSDDAVTLLAWLPWVGAVAGASTLVPAVGPAPTPLVGGSVAVVGWVALRWWYPRLRAARVFGPVGLAALVPLLWVTGRAADGRTAAWLVLGFVGAAGLGAWGYSAITRHGGSQRAGRLGAVVVFGQAFDALTTGIGVDVLGYSERTPISAAIISVTEGLPLAGLVGASWVFIAVKLVLAVGVVVLFVDVGDDSATNSLVVWAAAVAGVWPAVHNVVLFATT